MSTNTYSLKVILAALCKVSKNSNNTFTAKKRTLFNKAAVGGMSSRTLKLFFLSLPFIEFAIIFNPIIFAKLGIAQSIVFYIVFMSIIMIIIFFVSWKNNKSVLEKVIPAWNEYFPDVDLKQVLSSGVSPYNKFFSEYSRLLDKNLSPTDLKIDLRKSFDDMQEENKDLLEAIARDSSR